MNLVVSHSARSFSPKLNWVYLLGDKDAVSLFGSNRDTFCVSGGVWVRWQLAIFHAVIYNQQTKTNILLAVLLLYQLNSIIEGFGKYYFNFHVSGLIEMK